MAKRYYWLKLKEDFFDDDTISYIEEQENGVYYVNFYLKLCLKSLKTDGKLIRLVGETIIPYDVNSLSKLTGTPVDTVRVAMALFDKIGIIKILETGEMYLSQIEEMVGTETDKAAIMRRKRAVEKISGNNVTEALPERYTEKELEKDIDTDKEIDKEDKSKESKHKHGEYSHVLLTQTDYQKLVEQYGEEMTEKAITFLDEYIEMKNYRARNHYLAIKKWVVDAVNEREAKKGKKGDKNESGGQAEEYKGYVQRLYEAGFRADFEGF